jgi:hypothetical protein
MYLVLHNINKMANIFLKQHIHSFKTRYALVSGIAGQITEISKLCNLGMRLTLARTTTAGPE